uniref:Uncharacterized protein n=1 Tax=Sphaerodactylus townsendi TaxID=933632 RepID=A0ACB8EZI7_9SAUR
MAIPPSVSFPLLEHKLLTCLLQFFLEKETRKKAKTKLAQRKEVLFSCPALSEVVHPSLVSGSHSCQVFAEAWLQNRRRRIVDQENALLQSKFVSVEGSDRKGLCTGAAHCGPKKSCKKLRELLSPPPKQQEHGALSQIYNCCM